MTLLSKIWDMCFAGFGKVIWKAAAAGPILPVLVVYGMSVCSCALDGGACLNCTIRIEALRSGCFLLWVFFVDGSSCIVAEIGPSNHGPAVSLRSKGCRRRRSLSFLVSFIILEHTNHEIHVSIPTFEGSIEVPCGLRVVISIFSRTRFALIPTYPDPVPEDQFADQHTTKSSRN
jgi:hypothetical protein